MLTIHVETILSHKLQHKLATYSRVGQKSKIFSGNEPAI